MSEHKIYQTEKQHTTKIYKLFKTSVITLLKNLIKTSNERKNKIISLTFKYS